jgi:hypothetical protein
MEIKKCHLCSADIFPGEKRCLIAVHIFPDQENDVFLESFCSDEPCAMSGCGEDACRCDEGDGVETLFQEIQLVLCKHCQERFMKNPMVTENLLFLQGETESKTLH